MKKKEKGKKDPGFPPLPSTPAIVQSNITRYDLEEKDFIKICSTYPISNFTASENNRKKKTQNNEPHAMFFKGEKKPDNEKQTFHFISIN